MIVLDTNVISEVLRPSPEPAVLAWLRVNRRRDLWTCSVVLAELFSGVDLMPSGRRQQILREKTEQMVSMLFAGQILNFDVAAARAYGRILAKRQSMGRPIAELDAQIAAIAGIRRRTCHAQFSRLRALRHPSDKSLGTPLIPLRRPLHRSSFRALCWPSRRPRNQRNPHQHTTHAGQLRIR